MKHTALFSASVLLLLFASCIEKPPLVDLGGSTVQAADTTYIASVESKQPRNVMIEDFTGVSCAPCPAGHATLKSLLTQYPGRLVIMASHVYGIAQANPVHGVSKYDFRTQDGTDLGASFGGLPFIPSAVIDRVPDGSGDLLQSRNTWPNSVSNRINVATPINLALTQSYSDADRMVTAKVRIAYTSDVMAKHNLMVAVIENEIIDAQKNPTNIDTFYTHYEVLRDIITPISGVPLLDSISVKKAGRVMEKSLTFKLDPTWNPDNCRIVAYVHFTDPADRSVLQAVEGEIR